MACSARSASRAHQQHEFSELQAELMSLRWGAIVALLQLRSLLNDWRRLTIQDARTRHLVMHLQTGVHALGDVHVDMQLILQRDEGAHHPELQNLMEISDTIFMNLSDAFTWEFGTRVAMSEQ